jgi:hypothetical protein
MLWFLVILMIVIVVALVIGVLAGRGSQSARAHGLDAQRDVHGDIRAR